MQYIRYTCHMLPQWQDPADKSLCMPQLTFQQASINTGDYIRMPSILHWQWLRLLVPLLCCQALEGEMCESVNGSARYGDERHCTVILLLQFSKITSELRKRNSLSSR